MPDVGTGVVLVGLPTSGKSTVGRLIAERLGRPFIDTDELLAQRVGMPVADYIDRHGESRWREVESEARDVEERRGGEDPILLGEAEPGG